MILTRFEKQLPAEAMRSVLHIGAHVGGEADRYEQAGFREVSWVEADPDLFAKLCQRVGTGRSIPHRAFQALITRQSGGTRTLYRFSNNGGSNSMFRSNELFRENMGDVRETGVNIELPEISMDDLAAEQVIQPTTLVIDVQGAELEVLLGGLKTLKSVWVLEVEVSRTPIYEGGAAFKDVDALLKDAGFVRITRAPWHGDVLYVNAALCGSSRISALASRARLHDMGILLTKLRRAFRSPFKIVAKLRSRMASR
jgi:FkbM family methyltransferase